MRNVFILCLTLVGLVACSAEGRHDEFVVVAYNLENCFDVDGFALYDDYQQDEADDPFTYSRAKLLTKLQNATRVLARINGERGPEIILFQEFEADFSPESGVADYDAFLRAHADVSAEQMLTDAWQAEYAGIPAVAWMLKALEDAGMRGYEVVDAPAKPVDAGIAHTNAVFSKYPIRSARRHEVQQARDILEVEIDVHGHSLIVFNNHWKSGASNPAREPVRVQNAEVLRRLVDARLKQQPQADILIGGDLNSHYNHSKLFPQIKTGMNDVLSSQGNESFTGADLYNLWFELPPRERYSEVWRGRRGTLMHLLASPGLYDASGINYLDGSFRVVSVPGLNADVTGRPLKWTFAGAAGGGFSDHFPLVARFRTAPFQVKGALSRGEDAPDYEFYHDVIAATTGLKLPDGAFLNQLGEDELGPYVGKLYQVHAVIQQMKPFEVKVGDRVWSAYAANRSMVGEAGLPAYLKHAQGRVTLVVRLHIYRGRRQWVVENIL